MNIKNYVLLKNSTILSSPGLFSIFLSLISIPIHLNVAGTESYGNYIIFHFILIISIIFNFGIGKSITISINNFPKKNKEVAYEGLKYTFVITGVLLFILYVISFFEKSFYLTNLISSSHLVYVVFGFVISIFYSSLEGILQGNHRFKSLSFYNFMFFSLSISLPSISLLYLNNLILKDLIIFSLSIKLTTIIFMFLMINFNNLIKKSRSKILLVNLKKNAKWLTLNSLLIQLYDLFDKYLIKIFLGPIAIATYAIPQQLTGKLSIFSKGFSAFLLPNLSKRKSNTQNLNYTLDIFLKLIPLIILLLFPFFEIFLEYWLGKNFNKTILILTKIFSICSIFACASHLLVTKFEASKTLYRNLKIEFTIMPFFLFSLFYLTSNYFTLIHISIFILLKEWFLLFLRLNLLKNEIKNLKDYYIISFTTVLALYLSIYSNELFFALIILIILKFLFNK